ncbi:MAG: SAM-dependent chlorinase/fluorinase [Betaproteobacteria bacterium]|nr:SAM-dependent chlorinase/fluorinase [Betaproteobacteria bacterium]
MLVLYTDFGAADLYVGQIKAVLADCAPRVPVIDALHDAPAFGIEPSAHLLAALARRYPEGSVFLAVVDPGVGGPREAIVVDADGRTFVGPDNGLLAVLWERAARRRCRRVRWRPARLSATFHGRDLFAPVAAALALARVPRGWLVPQAAPDVLPGAADLPRIVYVDHYGNAVTGLRASAIPRNARLRAGDRSLARRRTFGDARPGEAFWYENSLGLVELAANRASAARLLGLRVGSPVAVLQLRLRARRSRGSR